MTIVEALSIVASGIALVTLAGCAVTDLMKRRIPNAAVMVLLGAYGAHVLSTGQSPSVIGLHLAVAVAAFAAGAGCHSAGWLGGGDVKLAAVVLLWAGPALTPLVFMVTGAIGIVVALTGYLIQRLELSADGMIPSPVAVWSASRGVPYGIGLSVAGMLVVLSYS